MKNRKLNEYIIHQKLLKRDRLLSIKLNNSDEPTEILNFIAEQLESVNIVELSANTISDKNFLDIAQKTKQLSELYDSTLIIRGRSDVAYLVSADCINLEQESLDIHSVKKIIGEDILIGSILYKNDNLDLVKDGADYIFLENLHSTPTESVLKTELEYAKWVSENSNIPVLYRGQQIQTKNSQARIYDLHSCWLNNFPSPIFQ